ncbi:GAF domain-containing protein [Hyalangium minutum]|uniref:PAS/PAC domain protein n=1 Tax=Hyalangium minutum TaxID=394096 RepID=A0A085WK10_9BACT|nr:GAF domain-containing protein [Hyalangium minutum]KFE68023.1 PAS/PAC domain protein [Hyalangium minutum]
MAWGLIVDPDTASSSKFHALLVELGLEPISVPDGKAAKATLLKRSDDPAVVITELSLAGIDGFELIREVRKRSPFARIIVVSSFVKMRNAALERKELLGIQEVLAKGIPLESYRRAVHRVLGRTPPEASTTAASPGEPPGPLAPVLPPRPVPFRAGVPAESAAAALARERARLAKLASLQLVDEGPPEESLQRLVQETAQAFNVPIALLSLVFEDRQWFKAHVGLAGQVLQDRGTERDVALCAHVVEAEQPGPLVVPDATTHPVFSTNRLVREGLFRSYAGAPLITREGTVLGTLCILDRQPLSISAEQVDALVALARRVAGELELRVQLRRSQHSLHVERNAHAMQRLRADVLAAALNGLDDAVMILDHRRVILFANEYMALLADRTVAELIGQPRDVFVRSFATRFQDPLDFMRRVRVLADGPYVGREDFELQQFPRRVVRWMSKPVAFADGQFGQVTVYRDVTEEVELAEERAQRLNQEFFRRG